MDEYISKITLDIDGQQIEDFTEITESKVELRKEVVLANKVGFCNVQNVRKLTLKYVLPKGRAPFDFEGKKGGTLTIDHGDGTRRSFKDVCTLSVGDVTKGKDDAAEQDIEMLTSGLQ